MTKDKIIITFGEMLKEEFLEPMGISQYQLAKSIGVSTTLINKIVKNKTVSFLMLSLRQVSK